MPGFPECTYTDVHVYRKNHVYVSCVSDELAEQNIDHAAVLRWLRGKWGHKSIDVAIRGMYAIDGTNHSLLNMGIDGTIVEFLFPGDRTEQVDPSDEGPSDLVHLRCMKGIGNHVYVAGMARRVYRRETLGGWAPIDDGVFVPRESRREAVGFNAIDGLDDQTIYAVGYKGEIWHLDGGNWSQEESPTNVVLNCISNLPNGEFYIGGMSGTLIRGSRGRWDVIEQEISSEDFWGTTSFAGRVYFSNYDGVFRVDGNELIPLEFGLEKKLSTAYLHAADGAMWSVGPKDLAYTTDGVNWVEVEGP